MYAGTYESHPVAIKKHKMDGSMMDHKALTEFEIEVRSYGGGGKGSGGCDAGEPTSRQGHSYCAGS